MWFLFPIYGKANAGLSLGVCFLRIFFRLLIFALRGEGGLRRPLSFNSERKGKRTPAKTTFLHFLSALYSSKRHSCIPRVRMRFSYSIHHRIVYAPAPLPLMPTLNNALNSAVAPHERQRRKMDRRYVIRSEKNHAPRTRGRRWQIRNRNSVRGFLNRRFKWRFWLLLPPRAKVTRGRSHETPRFPIAETAFLC